MRPRSLAIAASAFAAILLTTFTASAAGPPVALTNYLTPNGEVIWNLDALVKGTFGDRTVCFDGEREDIFAVAQGRECPGVYERYTQYVFTFRNAHGSDFRLVSLPHAPFEGANSSPIRVDTRYVSCPDGQGWLAIGGASAGIGPNGYFWCERAPVG